MNIGITTQNATNRTNIQRSIRFRFRDIQNKDKFVQIHPPLSKNEKLEHEICVNLLLKSFERCAVVESTKRCIEIRWTEINRQCRHYISSHRFNKINNKSI